MANSDAEITINVTGIDEFNRALETAGLAAETLINSVYELEIAQGWVLGPSKHLPCLCYTTVKFNGAGMSSSYSETSYCPIHRDIPIYD